MYKILSFTIILVWIVGCKTNTKKQETENSAPLMETVKSYQYQSDDSTHTFLLTLTDDKIKLKDLSKDTIYNLHQVSAASGAKYEDENGHTFWTKGNDFIFYKEEEKITKGTCISSNSFSVRKAE